MSIDALITEYLHHLETASATLHPDVRRDLITDVRGHLQEIRRSSSSEVEVRNALDDLGSPDAIVAAASDGPVVAPPGPDPAMTPERPKPAGIRGLDVLAVVLLVFGVAFLAPFLGIAAFVAWPIGLLLLWISPTWTTGEKTAATLIWPGGIALPLLGGLLSARTCTSGPTPGGAQDLELVAESCQGFALPLWVGAPVGIAAFVAPILVGVVLLIRAHRRTA